MWTRFYDMSSGGGTKTPFDIIYIEAKEKAAIWIFKDYFENIDPNGENCSTCGSNFYISEFESELDVIKDSKDSWHRNNKIKFIRAEEFTQDQKDLCKINDRYLK